MSSNYARELLKISLSQLCTRIGFDTTSEIAMDILVDICERQFEFRNKQTSNLLAINHHTHFNFFHFLSICGENLSQLEDYMIQFRSLRFSQEIVQFPYQKKNHLCLRIPSKESEQLQQREQDQSTEYIYDWLPLFPDQETPEQLGSTLMDISLDATISNDQEKRIEKSDSHHPLTLLSFLSKNGDETNLLPVGKRPNRSLPSILYRPRRITDMEAALAAVEKAKKEQTEKENAEKDQQQGPPPPIRLTIPKPLGNNDKLPLPTKKSTNTVDNTLNKKQTSQPLLNTTSPSLIPPNKTPLLSPTPIETHSQPNPLTHSSEILTNLDVTDDVVLDLTKPSKVITPPAKLPTLKLNIKNMSNSQITINTETPPTATKKISRPTATKKTDTHQKMNLNNRTSSLPLFGGTNESVPIISPPLSQPLKTSPIEPPIISNPPIIEKKPTIEIDPPPSILEMNSEKKISSNEEEKKKKKKKHHRDHERKDEKRIKKEENIPIETLNNSMEIDPIPSTQNSSAAGGTIRLKIKLGKPSNPPPVSSSTTNHQSQINPAELKANPIRLTLPTMSSTVDLIRPPIVSTIDRTPHRRKSGKVKRVPQTNETSPSKPFLTLPSHEDYTNSIDDLPLVERTSSSSPHKTIPNPISTNLTITKKKSTPTNNNKKKSNSKRPNNTVGVAVIEERRIHHDSQEKVWICPSCNRPDNGQEAMIACDLCDDWYHWECVGISEEPPESIPWFCPKCHRSNSSTSSAQAIKPSASSKAKRQRASEIFKQQQQPSHQ